MAVQVRILQGNAVRRALSPMTLTRVAVVSGIGASRVASPRSSKSETLWADRPVRASVFHQVPHSVRCSSFLNE